METHQTPLQTLTQNEYKGLWNKSWVRPFESLWSIINRIDMKKDRGSDERT